MLDILGVLDIRKREGRKMKRFFHVLYNIYVAKELKKFSLSDETGQDVDLH